MKAKFMSDNTYHGISPGDIVEVIKVGKCKRAVGCNKQGIINGKKVPCDTKTYLLSGGKRGEEWCGWAFKVQHKFELDIILGVA